MTEECKDASLLLMVPYFNFEVVTAADEEWLLIVKCNSSDWAIVLIKLLEECADTIIPQLNDTRM